MNETLFFGSHRVVGFGAPPFALGDVGDLLAYRQEWEPFIGAHLELWRDLNELLERQPEAQKCPPGIFTAAAVKDDPTGFCVTLSLSRARVSPTDPGGILTQWNAWKDKSSADIVAGAASMLESHQNTVMRVGGIYTKELLDLHKSWRLNPPVLPDVPSFSAQAQLRARIEGAYIATKGVIQLIGYSASSLLGEARDIADATAKGLTDAAKAIPSTARTVAIVATVAAVVVGGVLIVYYAPRPKVPEPAPT
jgi:hypothetical protein